MFSGGDSVRIRSKLSREEVEGIVEDSFGSLGAVDFRGRNRFRVSSRRFQTAMAQVTIQGELREGRKDGEWVLSIDYTVSPSTLCWVLFVLGILFLLIGVLVLLFPYQEKGRIERAVERAIRDAKDDAESDEVG